MKLFNSRFLKVFVCILLIVNIVSFSVVKRYSASFVIPALVVVGAGAVVAYIATVNNAEWNAACEAFGSEIAVYMDFRGIHIESSDPALDLFGKLGNFFSGVMRPFGVDPDPISSIIPNSFIYSNPTLRSLFYTCLTSVKENGVDCFRNKVLALPITNDIMKAFDEFFGYNPSSKVVEFDAVAGSSGASTTVVTDVTYDYSPSLDQSYIDNYQSALRNVDAFSSRMWVQHSEYYDGIDYTLKGFALDNLGTVFANSIVFVVDSSSPSYGYFFLADVVNGSIVRTNVSSLDSSLFPFLSSNVLGDSRVPDCLCTGDTSTIIVPPFYHYAGDDNSINSSSYGGLSLGNGFQSDNNFKRFLSTPSGLLALSDLLSQSLLAYSNFNCYVIGDTSAVALTNIDDWLSSLDLAPIDFEKTEDEEVIGIGLPSIDANIFDDTGALVTPIDGIDVPARSVLSDDTSAYLDDIANSFDDVNVDVGEKALDAINELNPSITISDTVPVEATTPDTGTVPPSGSIPGFPSSQLWDVWKYVEYLFGQGLAFVNFAKDAFLSFPWQARWLLYGVLVFVSLVGVFRRLLG